MATLVVTPATVTYLRGTIVSNSCAAGGGTSYGNVPTPPDLPTTGQTYPRGQ